MRFPQTIQHLGIFSPATSVARSPEKVERGRQRLLASGVSLVCPPLDAPPLRSLAAPDASRLAQLHTLLDNPDVDALMAMRGGYGTASLLDGLDWQLLRSRNLPVVGYSDLTALHLAALRHGCRRHIYGPMLASTFGSDNPAREQTLHAFERLLNDTPRDLLAFGREQLAVVRPGAAQGPLVPACLSVLVTLIGTPHLPDLSRHILALEDVDEPAYRIDRMLNQLRQAGILAKLAGLAFGTFRNCEDAQQLPDIFAEYAACVNGPVIANLPFGHLQPALSLPVGAHVLLNAQNGDIRLERTALDDYQSHIHTSAATGQTLGYRWLEPLGLTDHHSQSQTYPLILFLHGAGERGEDNHAQLVHCLPRFVEPDVRHDFPCFVCAPQCPAGQQWVNTPWNATAHTLSPQPSDALAHVFELLDDLLLDYPIDPTRIYVMGISMGGYGTWDALSRQPERFAAAVPICGGADLAQAPTLAHIPIWTFHGDSDTVVPTSRTRDIAAAIRALNPRSFRYTEVPHCGHDSWNTAIRTPELLPWLFAQHR